MRRSRRKTQRRRRIVVSTVLLVLVAAAVGWWYLHRRGTTFLWPANAPTATAGDLPGLDAAGDAQPLIIDAPGEALAQADQATTGGADEVLRPQGASASPRSGDAPLRQPGSPTEIGAGPGPAPDEPSDNPHIKAARRWLAEGKIIAARHALNALLRRPLPQADQTEVCELLTRIADDTIFSKRRLPDDPLVTTYTVQSGDVLIRIGREYKLPPEILMRINGIRDATKIRPDQKLKVLRGPFHAKIHKSDFRLDVYLQDLYVRSFRVALGTDQGTPEGVWRIKERLPNPTYFPPASAEEKRVIAADDPANPLGEHWIGLLGLEGDALGREGYGIHGTIEPESIGKAVSMGCVRMHNQDVAFLYTLLLPGQSTVTILP